MFYLPLYLWRYPFLVIFHLKFSAYKINGLTFSLVCIHDKNNIIFVWEILYGTNNMTRYFSNLARKNIWCKNTIRSENDSAWMIFLVYRYVRYIKTSIWLKPSILLLWYHLRKARQKNITQKEIKFPFGWCSWIFDLTSDGQDTIIIKFNHESFSIIQYKYTPDANIWMSDFQGGDISACEIYILIFWLSYKLLKNIWE